MPLGFDKIPGQVPVHAAAGDGILHDCYLCHSTARATDDVTTRRHVRGSWFGGDRGQSELHEFIKNAAR